MTSPTCTWVSDPGTRQTWGYSASTIGASATYSYPATWTSTSATTVEIRTWGSLYPWPQTLTYEYNEPVGWERPVPVPSSRTREELDRQEQREREATEERAERQRERLAAAERATELLRQVLTAEQWTNWQARQWFDLPVPSGRTYRIRHGIAGNIRLVDEAGQPMETLCCHPSLSLPVEDVVAAQVLALRADEEGFRRTANISRSAAA